MSTNLEQVILALNERIRILEENQKLKSFSPFISNSLNQVSGCARRVNITDRHYIDADGTAYLNGVSVLPILNPPLPPTGGYLIYADAADGNQPKILDSTGKPFRLNPIEE